MWLTWALFPSWILNPNFLFHIFKIHALTKISQLLIYLHWIINQLIPFYKFRMKKHFITFNWFESTIALLPTATGTVRGPYSRSKLWEILRIILIDLKKSPLIFKRKKEDAMEQSTDYCVYISDFRNTMVSHQVGLP